MRDLAGATILVTGATDGLGRRVALELAGKGAAVLIPRPRQGALRGTVRAFARTRCAPMITRVYAWR